MNCRCLFQLALCFTVTNIFGFRIRYQLKPLLGGPEFAKLHVKVIIASQNGAELKMDFIPQAATEKQTIMKLLCLQPVPGIIRITDTETALASNGKRRGSDEDIAKLKAFATRIYNEEHSQNRTQMHLLLNNCYSFANRVRLAVQEENYRNRKDTVD